VSVNEDHIEENIFPEDGVLDTRRIGEEDGGGKREEKVEGWCVLEKWSGGKMKIDPRRALECDQVSRYQSRYPVTTVERLMND